MSEEYSGNFESETELSKIGNLTMFSISNELTPNNEKEAALAYENILTESTLQEKPNLSSLNYTALSINSKKERDKLKPKHHYPHYIRRGRKKVTIFYSLVISFLILGFLAFLYHTIREKLPVHNSS
jgi:hypothetical protein